MIAEKHKLSFLFFSFLFTSDGVLDTEIAHRVANASSAFARLH